MVSYSHYKFFVAITKFLLLLWFIVSVCVNVVSSVSFTVSVSELGYIINIIYFMVSILLLLIFVGITKILGETITET